MKKETLPPIKQKQIPLDNHACYEAFKAHDSRFDGQFFIGISSTGIYCRPVCRVKMPKEENCTYYPNAAAAEQAGYRPCLKCRPELAPGNAPIDTAHTLALQAARIIESEGLVDSSIASLATSLGFSPRHLGRVFLKTFGVSPVQYLQTTRLLLAKSLLTDSNLTITQVALASGFGSIRRFNDLFLKHYRLSPSALRKSTKNIQRDNKDTITLFLGYRPPYRWEELLSFLALRTVTGVEKVEDNSYYRTVNLSTKDKSYQGYFKVEHIGSKNTLKVTLSETLLPVLSKVLANIKHLFDLDANPIEIYEKLSTMNTIAPDMAKLGTRLPGAFDPFEMAVKAVLGQLITVKAAITLTGRLVATYGQKIQTPIESLTHSFPTPEVFFNLKDPIENYLGPLGITKNKARSIKALATALTEKEITLSLLSDPKTTTKLLTLPGFGPWTVAYIAMRALGWPDAFPATDYGVKKALANYTPEEQLELSKQWQPWRSYATMNLWHSL